MGRFPFHLCFVFRVVRLRFVHPLYFLIFTNPLYFFTLSFALPSCFFLFFVFALGLNNHLLLHAIILLLQVEKASWFP